jgi:hypothetical protein
MVHRRGDEFYCYELELNQNEVTPPSVAVIGEWTPPAGEPARIVGPGVLGYRDRWAAGLGDQVQIVSAARAIVGGDQLALWGVRNLKVGSCFSVMESPLDYGLPPTFRQAS